MLLCEPEKISLLLHPSLLLPRVCKFFRAVRPQRLMVEEDDSISLDKQHPGAGSPVLQLYHLGKALLCPGLWFPHLQNGSQRGCSHTST